MRFLNLIAPVFFISISFLLPLSSPALAGTGQAPPRLVIKSTQIDAGTVVEGAAIRHTFLFQNRGNGPLILSDVRADCSCTKIQHEDVIAPLSNSYFRVAFHTLGRSGDQVKTIHMGTNDPALPEVTLKITAHILPAVKVEPDRVFFNGPQGKRFREKVLISSPNDTPFGLVVEKKQLPGQVEMAMKKIREGRAWEVIFTGEGSLTGTFRGRVLLKTDIPLRPMILIPVMARVTNSLAVFPKALDFGRLRLSLYRRTKTPDPVLTLHLKSADGVPPEIDSMKLPLDRFKVEASRLPDLGAARITVTARIRAFEAGQYKDQLLLTLKSGEQVQVPVRLAPY